MRAAPDVLVGPGSAVVLLVGLAGDSESESAYQGQLSSWLEFLDKSAQHPEVVILSDQGTNVGIPSSLQVRVLPANRTNFLTLGKLVGVNHSVLLVAWGHGGRQGGTPVFHVRGPRLTPDDFAAVAGGLHRSDWILLFRGSGSFASRLAGNDRAILASEYETEFNSDPVGMSVLLKILRSEPGLGFEEMAHRVGAGTAAWYEERHLARTEEATLWLAGQAPERVAVVGHATSGAAEATPEIHARSEAESVRSSNASTNAVGAGTEPRSGPPPSWKAIQKVEPSRYSDSDGVILKQEIVCTLGSRPAVTIERDQYLQVLTAEGKKLGDFDVSYSPPEEEVEFLDCEVLRPDGSFLRADPDSATAESGDQPGADYRANRRRFFSLPGVVPGAVLHVHYRTQWKEFPLPHVSMAIPLVQELPVIKSSVEVRVPKGTPFHFAFDGLSAPDPVLRQTAYSSIYRWGLENLSLPPREPLEPPHREKRLLFSTFPDWSAFAGWYGRITRLTAETTAEIRSKATELTRGFTNQQDQVRALYNYVTGLRYVAVPLGVNSLRPHSAANVLRNQYGDCKDKANLLNALLASIHVDASLVLVPRFGQADPAVPGCAFNHAISRVRLGPETLWVDTTDDICRFGLLPPGDPGRNVLVADGESSSLVRLPQPEPSDHQVKFEAEVDASSSAEGGGWPVQFRVTAHGFPDYQFREVTREAGQGMAAVPLIAIRWRPVAGSFAGDHQTMTLASQLDQDFTWRGEGTLIGLSASAGEKRVLRSPFWLPKEWDLALHRRHNALFLNQGYPLIVDEEFKFRGVPGAAVAPLPSPCENVKLPLRWRVEWTRVADDQIQARFHAEVAPGELSQEDTTAFQGQLRRLLSALATEATYNPDPGTR